MTTPTQLFSGIEAAATAISEVRQSWEPADLALVRASFVKLDEVLAALRTSFAWIQSAAKLPALELAAGAQALRDEAIALEFLVDAAAAFVRSSAAVSGLTAQTYDLAGEIRLDTPPAIEAHSA